MAAPVADADTVNANGVSSATAIAEVTEAPSSNDDGSVTATVTSVVATSDSVAVATNRSENACGVYESKGVTCTPSNHGQASASGNTSEAAPPATACDSSHATNLDEQRRRGLRVQHRVGQRAASLMRGFGDERRLVLLLRLDGCERVQGGGYQQLNRQRLGAVRVDEARLDSKRV